MLATDQTIASKYYCLNPLSSIAVHAVWFPNKLRLTNMKTLYFPDKKQPCCQYVYPGL